MSVQRRRSGLTLVEMLAAIAIIALLVALLLPAIQRARTAADRITASNQMRQILLAIHNYAGAKAGALPVFRSPALMNRPVPGYEGVFAPILPYLEENNILEATSNGSTVTYVAVYRSPLDPSSAALYAPSAAVRSGTISFAANYQVFSPGAALATRCWDGASNTIGIGERFARCGTTNSEWDFANGYCIDANDNIIPCVDPLNRRASFADPNYDDIIPVTQGGRTQPSTPGATFQVGVRPSDCNYRMLQTSFAGGIFLGLMDGSVRTVTPSISAATFWSAVTPASGDVLGNDWW